MMPLFTTGARILFQGDSITDGNRGRSEDPNHILGHGYAFILAAKYGCQFPERRLTFLNRGISGNTVAALQARWREDTLAFKPDLLSVLIGVNDTWHEFGGQNGVAVPKFERLFRDFLTEVRAALPAIKFVLCEPFVLPCGVVTKDWITEMNQRRVVVKKLAGEFDAVFVPFQTLPAAALLSVKYVEGLGPTKPGVVAGTER